MLGFPAGMIVLLVLSVLIYFGVAQRALDRMQLSDRAALGIIAAIIIGSFVNLPFSVAGIDFSINVGGAVIPVILSAYLLVRAGTRWEQVRALLAAVVTAGTAILINSYWLRGDLWQTGRDVIDPMFVYPLAAGIVAYLLGRSRRAAFIGAVVGVLLLDFYDLAWLIITDTPGVVSFGGAGAFDAIILSGVIAVFLAEVIGEGRERLQGGPKVEGHPEPLLKHLRNIESEPKIKKPESNGGNDHEK